MVWGNREGQVSSADLERLRFPRFVRPASATVLTLCLAGFVTANSAQASVRSPASGSSWKIEKTPNPAGAVLSSLNAVSCRSATDCTAVGSDETDSGGGTLAERWNGKTWNVQTTVTPKGTTGDFLYGVSCGSSTACQAVGTLFRTTSSNTLLAESGNGKKWRVETTPTPKGTKDGGLFAVSCTSPSACTAVGNVLTTTGVTHSLIERWNGKAWAIQASAKAARNTWLFGVSCTSASACIAAGYQNPGTGDAQLLAETWNGKVWKLTKTPRKSGSQGGIFDAVSCTSATACTATGTSFDATAPTLAERWNGKAWKVQTTPNPSNYKSSVESVALDGVSCTSATACTASGQYAPGGSGAYFAEVWNGKTWRLQSTPEPAGFTSGALSGVSCVLSRCVAVGAASTTGPQQTLAMVR
jgi:hypothetical protein